jgi:hypothetical protein
VGAEKEDVWMVVKMVGAEREVPMVVGGKEARLKEVR